MDKEKIIKRVGDLYDKHGCLFNGTLFVVVVLAFVWYFYGLVGVGWVFATVAFMSFFGFTLSGDLSADAEIRLKGLVVACITGVIAAFLLTEGENIDKKSKAEEEYEKLLTQPTIDRCRAYFQNYSGVIESEKETPLLEIYYQMSKDSCLLLLSKNTKGMHDVAKKGFEYLESFAESCNNDCFRTIAEEDLKLIIDSLYTVADKINTFEAWQAYQSSVPTDCYRDSQDKKDAVDRRWSTESKAWATATTMNTLYAYKRYLTKYPKGKHKKIAEKKIVDLEVSVIFAGKHGTLPKMDRVSKGKGSTSRIGVYNNTNYTLTLLYSGPESKRLEIAPKSRGSLRLKNGAYRVAASVSALNVQNYAGNEQLVGGAYDVEYYISNYRY